jgi:hypothetical protein
MPGCQPRDTDRLRAGTLIRRSIRSSSSSAAAGCWNLSMRRLQLIGVGAAIVAAGMAGAVAVSPAAFAHHGFGTYDASTPVWISGTVTEVRWANPHPQLTIELPAGVQVPADDLLARSGGGELDSVGGQGLIVAAVAPPQEPMRLTLELSPISRLQGWGVDPIPEGAVVGAIGFPSESVDDQLRAVALLLPDGRLVATPSPSLPLSFPPVTTPPTTAPPTTAPPTTAPTTAPPTTAPPTTAATPATTAAVPTTGAATTTPADDGSGLASPPVTVMPGGSGTTSSAPALFAAGAILVLVVAGAVVLARRRAG